MDRRFDSDENAWDSESSGEPEEPWKQAHETWKRTLEKKRRDPGTPPVWNEELWEDFMKIVDRDELKVIAFYEKFWSHSARDRMVEEAMAMYYVREAFKRMGVEDPAGFYLEHYVELELEDMGIAEEGSEGFLDAKEHTLYEIAAYRTSREFFSQWRAYVFTLHDYNRLHRSVEYINLQSGLACNKIVGGHVMGYQPYTLGGNIAQAKRALLSVQRAMAHLREIRNHLYMDDDQYGHLSELATEARDAIAIRVVDLRNHFFDLC